MPAPLIDPSCSDYALAEYERSPMAEEREQALGMLIERHQNPILDLLTFLCGDASLAHDLRQEAFITSIQQLDQLRDPAAFRPWLVCIARNTWRIHARQLRAHPVVSLTPLLEAGKPFESLRYVEPELEQIAEHDLVERVVAQLSDICREALYLRHFLGLSDAELAQVLGISPAAAQKRAYRAEVAFRQQYAAILEPNVS